MVKNYRPEIDGLRAIAVVSVILYHAQITILGHQPFQGGFIGVDIFFVISGYLITSIILKELVTTGSFSFKHFYERRIRRILPVLLFVMLVSLPFAWMYLLPTSFIDFSKSILYSLGFSSNFYFHYTGQQYGAESGLLKPFLHTWSLSVEEQYYILFPIILLVVFKFFRKYLIHLLILGFVMSLGLADWGSRNHPSFNFYILLTRGWELLAGSLLAYFEITKNHRSTNKTLNLILPTIGLLLVGLSIFFSNDEMRHPSLYTLTPIIGVCLIIWFADENDIITKILSTKPLVAIGLISYSLYLWHYPIFAFARVINFFNDQSIIVLIVITVIFSILSFLYIERPFRNKKFKFKTINLIIIPAISLILIATAIQIKNYGFENRFQIYEKNSLDHILLDSKSWFFTKNDNQQYFSKDKRIKILIVGDSFAKDLYNFFYLNKDLYGDYEFKRYSTGYHDNMDFALKYNERYPELINSELYKGSNVILISDRLSDGQEIKNLHNFIKKIKKQKVVMLSSLSNIYENEFIFNQFRNLTIFDKYLMDNYLKKKRIHIDSNLSKKDFVNINQSYFNKILPETFKINEKLKQIAEIEKIKFLDKSDYLCNSQINECYGITDKGYKIFYDFGHYTLEGAKYLGKIGYDINWFNLKNFLN